ncbi:MULTISPECIES: putative quinol monooxygenase [Photobacterium]|jgi:quinol monooxygenase YgiN|uniref:Antibiotic biosynthesis monooxygenase n=1 Tax=Photobacterium indicum TaxID=81447 RepID=A0A2T3LA93_9GAMM|nr:antibiotic biosynthesis monooxygenase [Photobacterium indicum]PSV48255.1 antibiotic biosynthesis monooxygenase [Photobacterium indicum]
MFKQGLFITAELRIKPESDLNVAIAAIQDFCDGMNSEEGCSMAIPLQDKKDPRRFIFWERYDNQEAFETHFHAEHTQRFIQAGLTDLVQAFETQLLTADIK